MAAISGLIRVMERAARIIANNKKKHVVKK
jgi:hypothetical protein